MLVVKISYNTEIYKVGSRRNNTPKAMAVFSGLTMFPEDAMHISPFLGTFLPFSNSPPGPSITTVVVELSGLLQCSVSSSCDLSSPGGMRQMGKGQEEAALETGS